MTEAETLQSLFDECNNASAEDFDAETSPIGKPIISDAEAARRKSLPDEFFEEIYAEDVSQNMKGAKAKVTEKLIDFVGDKPYNTNPLMGMARGNTDKPPTWGPTFLNARHRRVLQLAAKGMKASQIADLLMSEGITMTATQITNVITSPLGRAEIERHMCKQEALLDEEIRVTAQMAQAALAVMHNATNGYVTTHIPDANGTPIPKHVAIKPDQMLRAAESVMNRFASTAPVQKQQVETMNNGLLKNDALSTMEARIAAARQVIQVHAEALA